jgi:hypothetical protein
MSIPESKAEAAANRYLEDGLDIENIEWVGETA